MHPEYPFTSHYLHIDSHRLHYIDEGDGPVVVALHGNPTWSFYYRKVVERLRHRCRVIAIDHMGCGFSDKPQDYRYDLANHIGNLEAVLHKLEITKCSLLVHDWGGAIGMGYAVRHPDTVQRIAVLNSAAFRSRRIPLRIRLCRLPVLGELIVRGCNGFAAPATFMAVKKPLARQTRKAYLLPYDSWRNRIAIHRFVQDIPQHEKDTSYSVLLEIEKGLEDIRRRRIPMLILWGGGDFCFTKEFYDEWRTRFPEAQAHYFPQYGHYVLEDGFEKLEPYLIDFFKPHED